MSRESDRDSVVEAFDAAVSWWHQQLDDPISNHTTSDGHPDRPDTAREYFQEHRQYENATIEDWRLGWAPPEGGLYEHLRTQGFDEETIRATGLFTEQGEPSALWRGRYIFPYFDAGGRAVYAIARTTGDKGGGAAGYDGHPEDYLAGKYAKVAHTRDTVPLEEPILGLHTLDDADTVIVAEGIADAITAAEAGHAVLSPVTTEFKREHFDAVVEAVESHGIETVYVVPDSEIAQFSRIDSDDVPEEPEHIFEAVNIPKVSPGIGGALRTANYLQEQDIDARVTKLPRSGLTKVDLDDYLHEWTDDLSSVTAASKPPQDYHEYDAATATQDTQKDNGQNRGSADLSTENGRSDPLAVEGGSALWNLDVGDVNTDLHAGYRGKNPLGHTGNSENYFVVYEKEREDAENALIARDYKRPGKPRYTGCTYLLVDTGERSVSAPEGSLSPEETWKAWKEARERGLIGETDKIPGAALEHIARDRGLYDFEQYPDDAEGLPPKAHNKALYWVEEEWWNPDGEKDTEATSRNYKSRSVDNARTWEDVRYIYEDDSNKARRAAEHLLCEKYYFITAEDDPEKLQVYDPETGTYSHSLGQVRSEIHQGLGKHWTTHELNEILSRLRQQEPVEAREMNGRGVFDTPHICVENGVLDLFEQEIKPHSPDYYYTDRVPVTFDPNADTKPYEQFLDEITGREQDADVLAEMVGHALTPDAYERGWKNILFLTGDSDNGKTVFFERVRDLLQGPHREVANLMSVKLDKMSTNRFSKDSMYGTMANIAGEVNGKKIRNTADIKDISGGDLVEIEPKGGQSFADTMNTTLMFAANDPPIIGERDKKSIARRLVPVELPHTFDENPDPDNPHSKQKKSEKELEEWLANPEALSGFLNLALDGIERLRENCGDVSLDESPMERLERYESTADPMREFAKKCLEPHPSDQIVKQDVTDIYKEYAKANGHEVGTSTHDTLHGALDYSESQPRPPYYNGVSHPLREWDSRKRVVDRVTLTETGLEYAEKADLVADDDGEETDTTTLLDAGTGMHQGPVKATIAEKIDPPEWLEGKGHLVDGDGGIMPYVVEAGDPLSDIEEGDTATIENVKVENKDGVPTAVLSGITKTSVRKSTTSADGDVTAAADGGNLEQQPEADTDDEETEPADTPDVAGITVPTNAQGTKANAQRIAQYVDERAPMPESMLKSTLTLDVDLMTPEEFDTALQKGIEEYGLVQRTDDGIASML